MNTSSAVIPKRPVLDWSSFSGPRNGTLPSVTDLPHKQATTSGRAAIYHAIKLIAPEPGSAVLIPTYHCPTMVAPAVLLGHRPIFYPIDEHGLPALELISDDDARAVRCMITPHYFGITQSFSAVRSWCDAHRIVLIEDCAHALYGHAGERHVGEWGDYATVSLSKFLPVPEAGLLTSAHHPLRQLHLHPQGLKAEAKVLFDTVHLATTHNRLHGLVTIVNGLHRSRRATQAGRPSAPPPPNSLTSVHSINDALHACDMARIDAAPPHCTRWLAKHLPQLNACEARQSNFANYAEELSHQTGAHSLHTTLPQGTVPYVYPLWVDDADRVYHALRLAGAPVFRWDSLWPTTPSLPSDFGKKWSRHILQLLCHQSLTPAALTWTLEAIRSALLNKQIATHDHRHS